MAITLHGPSRQLLQYLDDQPDRRLKHLPLEVIACETGLSFSTVQRAVRSLRALGFIQTFRLVGRGYSTTFTITDEGYQALALTKVRVG